MPSMCKTYRESKMISIHELGFLLSVVLAAYLGWTVRRVVEDRRERERREAFWKGERIT